MPKESLEMPEFLRSVLRDVYGPDYDKMPKWFPRKPGGRPVRAGRVVRIDRGDKTSVVHVDGHNGCQDVSTEWIDSVALTAGSVLVDNGVGLEVWTPEYLHNNYCEDPARAVRDDAAANRTEPRRPKDTFDLDGMIKSRLHNEIEHWFKYHPPKSEEVKRAHGKVRAAARDAAHAFVQACPPGQDLSDAIRLLRRASSAAHAAIACDC